MSCSAFAGSPLFIDLDPLVEQGLVKEKEITPPPFSEYTVLYQQAGRYKDGILRLAWKRFSTRSGAGDTLADFLLSQPWAADYGLFMALQDRYPGQPWYRWPLPLRHRQPEALKQVSKELVDEINYFIFEQYLFFSQWQLLRTYANVQGIRIIGDLPIYVALDSVDVWSNQQLFQLDPETCEPTHVAGVPPDSAGAIRYTGGIPLIHEKKPGCGTGGNNGSDSISIWSIPSGSTIFAVSNRIGPFPRKRRPP
jgi:4-alpha-glucanotransferase